MVAGFLVATGLSQFTAQEKEGSIPEITIAAKTKQQLYKTGKNVQLVTSKDLEKFKGQSLNEILEQVSGIQITGNFNNTSEPKSFKIRGGKMANVLILVDGIPLKDVTGNDYTASDIRLIAAENIESIEILNGASSVLYGSNATVSVINIKTKKSTQKPFEGRIGTRIGSFGTFAQNIILNGKKEHLNYQFSGFNEKSDGITAAVGKNFDKDGFEKQHLNASFGLNYTHFNINFNGGYQHHLYEYDNGAFEDGKYRNNDSQIYGGISGQYQYGKNSLNFNSRISGNNRLTQDLALNHYQDQYSYKGREIFAELYHQTQFSENANLIAGLQYEAQNLGAKSLPWGSTTLQETLNFKDTKITNFDVFVNTNLQYQLLHLDMGARLNNHSKYNNHFVYSINPYYLQNFGNIYLKIGYSFATAFIAPTLYQNYGSAPYVLPNFDLKPETNASHEIDFSIGKTNRSMVFNASFYQRKEKDIFVYKITNFINYSGQFENVDENMVKGFELGMNYQFNEKLNVGGNFSYAEKSNQSASLRYPKQKAGGFAEFLPFKNNRINLSYQFVSKRNDAYYDTSAFTTKNVVLDAFHLLNLNINQKINKKLETYLNVGNLLNTNYTDVIGFTTKPRTYTLGIDYKF